MNNNKLILSCKLPKGKIGVIKKIEGEKDFILRLRELGFGEGKTVSKFSDDAHRCIILNLDGRKIYLSEHAAHCIFVQEV